MPYTPNIFTSKAALIANIPTRIYQNILRLITGTVHQEMTMDMAATLWREFTAPLVLDTATGVVKLTDGTAGGNVLQWNSVTSTWDQVQSKTNKTIWVDTIYGDPTTAQVYNPFRPFQTIVQAIEAAASSGDTIRVVGYTIADVAGPITKSLTIIIPEGYIRGPSPMAPLQIQDDVTVIGTIGASVQITLGAQLTLRGQCTKGISVDASYLDAIGSIQGTITSTNGSDLNLVNFSCAGIIAADTSISAVFSSLSVIYAGTGAFPTLKANQCLFNDPVNPLEITVVLGSAGNHGMLPRGFSYSYSASLVSGDPGAGSFRLDSINVASATLITISTLDYNGNDLAAYLSALTSGILNFSQFGGTAFNSFAITSVASFTGYVELTITYTVGNDMMNGVVCEFSNC